MNLIKRFMVCTLVPRESKQQRLNISIITEITLIKSIWLEMIEIFRKPNQAFLSFFIFFIWLQAF